MRASAKAGFALVELVVALGVTLVITATIVDLVGQSRRRFEAEPEAVDRQQRARTAVDVLSRDLLMASHVMPYRIAVPFRDPPGTFRNDVVTFVSERAGEPDTVRTYYVRRDLSTGVSQLMRAEGSGGDAPVVDGVTSLQLEYFGEPPATGEPDPCEPGNGRLALVRIVATEFTDGPYCPALTGGDPIDADVRRIRRIAVRLRLAPQDREVRFEVTPRNRNHGR